MNATTEQHALKVLLLKIRRHSKFQDMKPTTKTGDPELFESVNMFDKLLCAGMRAQLVRECDSGSAHVK